MFFSEEKNQKTFIFSVASTFPAMAWILSRAPKQQSFGSFLQKGTFFLPAALAFLVPWACVTSYTLHFFYLSGAVTLLDSGWFVALTTHGSGLALPNPAVIRPGSYYSIHMSPLLAFIRILHGMIWTGFDAVWFSAIQAVWYGVIGLAVCLALRRTLPWLALPAALLTALSGIELATVGFPHFEVAMPAITLLFVAIFGQTRNPCALLLLALLLAVREDAGFHAGFLLLLAGCHFARTHDDFCRCAARAYFVLAALLFAGAAVSILIQHLFFPGGNDALHRVYLGRPPLAHVSLRFLLQRLGHLARYRLYIFVPVAVIVLAAIWLRDTLLLAGPLACVPWLLLAIIARLEQAGTLENYYAFPFIVALAWPAMCMALRRAPDKRLALLHMTAGALSIALIPLCPRNADPVPWRHALPPTWSTIRRTEAAIDGVLTARQSLGAWVADDPVASLRADAFTPEQVVPAFNYPALQVGRTDALFGTALPPTWLADKQARMIAESHLQHFYVVCGTMLTLHTRAALRDPQLLRLFTTKAACE